MKAQVTYNDDVAVTQIKLKVSSEVVGYAHMNGETAVLSTVYPMPGCDGVAGDELQEQIAMLESLPFVQAVAFEAGESE